MAVAALALGNTAGLTIVAVPLIAVTRRVLGQGAIRGVGRTTLVGLAAAAGGAAVGVGASLLVPASGKLAEAGAGALAAGCAVVVFVAIAFRLDEGEVRPALVWASRAVPWSALRVRYYFRPSVRSAQQRAGTEMWGDGEGSRQLATNEARDPARRPQA
jgi:hypothetical protein